MHQPGQDPLRLHVVHQGEAAERRLLDLSLSTELLLGAIQDGDDARQQCGLYHPRQAAPLTMWLETTAGLRRRTVPLDSGWTMDRTDNFETTVHKDKGLALAVMGGDEFTGYLSSKDPRVKRKRGPITQQRVTSNFLGMEPLFSDFSKSEDSEKSNAWTTWLLLIHAGEDWLYSELSQPIGFDGSGYVGKWAERIILPRIPTQGGVTPLADDEDDDGDTESSMVKRK